MLSRSILLARPHFDTVVPEFLELLELLGSIAVWWSLLTLIRLSASAIALVLDLAY